MKRYVWLLAIFAVILSTIFVVRARVSGWQDAAVYPSPTISGGEVNSPQPSSPPSPVASPTPSPLPSPSPSPLAGKVNLSVPFTIQAPDGQWIEPWEEGCEEAALLMADAFMRGSTAEIMPVAETKSKIQQMVDWQVERLGSHRDIGADEMAMVAREYLGYKAVRVKHNATLEDIRNELRQGRPVIVPAAGRLLNNPYFTPPGPIYHVFIITGFDGDQFIVNENGTRQGRSYTYSSTVLESALHDYRAGEPIVTGDMAYLVLER